MDLVGAGLEMVGAEGGEPIQSIASISNLAAIKVMKALELSVVRRVIVVVPG
jgi:hypothetical protein